MDSKQLKEGGRNRMGESVQTQVEPQNDPLVFTMN